MRDHLETMVDFAKVRALTELKLFIVATNVQTGRIKIFEGPELAADHVMASACLPYLFQAVAIDGVPYWDGLIGTAATWAIRLDGRAAGNRFRQSTGR